jgi:hypothetical protein
MNVLEQGSEWLNDQMRSHASSLVIYRRGSNQVDILAEKGKTEFRVTQNDMLIDVVSKDFLVSAAELVLGGERVIPQKYDIIVETIDGQETYFEVYPFGMEQPYRPCDSFGHRVRIHCRKVEGRR